MRQRICLLRGVNVGGVKVLMTELKAVAADLGLANPRTLLASGNLVVDSAADPADLEARLEAGIAARFGRPVEVMVRTPDQWAALIAANPFPEQAATDGSRLLVMVMKAGVADGALETLQGHAVGDERAAVVDGSLLSLVRRRYRPVEDGGKGRTAPDRQRHRAQLEHRPQAGEDRRCLKNRTECKKY